VSVHDELEAVMSSGRWGDLRPYVLADAGGGIGREVRAWYGARSAHWADHYRWASSWTQEGPVDGAGALRVVALACCSPAQASKELARVTWGWVPSDSDELAVAAAVARGREFCQPFLDAVSRLTFSKDDEWKVGWVARIGLPLVAAGVADLPEGPAFGRGWAAHHAEGSDEVSLVHELRASPAVAEGLALACASPGAMAHFERHRRPGRELEPAVAQLVEEGVLQRERVLEAVLAALTRQEPTQSQRALARLLGALRLSHADVATRVPLLLQLLATAHGSVTAALLPVLLETVDDDELPAVAATVFARREKAQQATLLRALVAPRARWGREARVAALAHAADLPEQAMAERAATALVDLGAEAPTAAVDPVDGLWTDPPVVPEAGPAVVVTQDEASMTAALSRVAVTMDASDGAMFCDAVVRRAWSDPAGARSWARGFDDRIGEVPRPSAFYALRREPWDVVTPESHRELCALVARLHTGVRADRDISAWGVVSRTTTQVLHDVFMSETKLRLGTVPLLLSTPTRTDATLDLPALVERLRGYAAGAHLAGPADLFVALSRLTPTDPARVHGLDGLTVGLWSPGGDGGRRVGLFRRRPAPVDAVEVVRRWLAGGGLPVLDVSHHGGTLVVAPPSLPVPTATFHGIPPSVLAGHEDGVHEEYADWSLGTEADAGMLPAWADLLAAKVQRGFDQKGRFAPLMLPAMVASPRPGQAVVHAVAATLSHADEDRRLLAVDAALTLIGRGLWQAEDYTTCCEHLLASGELRLARLAHSWEQLVLAGGLQALWPTAVVVLDRACALERKPAGLADLLGMLRRYVPAVPGAEVPGSVAALAASKGASKARAEAAAFVRAAS
jgi:hypothetical protein